MPRLTVLLFLAIASLGLSACETSLTRQQAGAVHKIGVISAIGSELNIRSFMPNAGGQDGLLDVVPIGDMALDPYVIDQATARLKDHYEIVPVAYSPATFRQTEDERNLHAAAIQGRTLGQVIRANTQLPDGMTAGTDSGVDIYLVILAGGAKLRDGDHALSGTSLTEMPAENGPAYNLGVVYWIAVIDGHSLQSVGNVNTLSDRNVDAKLWAPTAQALTADQKQQLAAVWKKRIDLTLAPALKRVPLDIQ